MQPTRLHRLHITLGGTAALAVEAALSADAYGFNVSCWMLSSSSSKGKPAQAGPTLQCPLDIKPMHCMGCSAGNGTRYRVITRGSETAGSVAEVEIYARHTGHGFYPELPGVHSCYQGMMCLLDCLYVGMYHHVSEETTA